MEDFKKLSEIILSINIGSSNFEGEDYLIISKRFESDMPDGDLIRLRNKAIIELINTPPDNSIRQVNRLKKIIKGFSDLLSDKGFNDNEDIIEQMRLTSSVVGFTIKDNNLNYNGKIATDNFLIDLEEEFWLRLFIIDRLEEVITERESEHFSIYGATGPVENIPYLYGKNELKWDKWFQISGDVNTSRLIKKAKIKDLRCLGDLFHDKYKAEYFIDILKKESDEILTIGEDLKINPYEKLINDNHEWIGPNSKVAYIFYDCLLSESIVYKINVAQLTPLFLKSFPGLSETFASTGRKPDSRIEENYKKHFINEIRLLKNT